MGVSNWSRYLELLWSIVLLLVDSICLAFSNLVPFSLKRKKDITNEIVLITGGGSGFGQLLAVRFAQLGCRVVIWDVDEKGCHETIAKVDREVAGADKVRSYILDVSNRNKVYDAAKKVKMDVGEVTILVNNAGIAHTNYFLDTADFLLEKFVNVNAMAHFWTLKAFLPNMLENNHGHLVSVASAAGLVGLCKGSAYSASKHAVMGFLDSIAMELVESSKTNVKTTVVCPAFARTNLFQCEYDGIQPLLKPETVADKILEGVLTDKETVYVPHSVALFSVLNRLVTKAAVLRLLKPLVGDSTIRTVKAKCVFEEPSPQGTKAK